MALSFDTYEAPIAQSKRRYKVYSRTFHVDENTEKRRERKAAIKAAETNKPRKRRAIASDRKLKYDERRGEEEPIDMGLEDFSSILSSRTSKPFTITRTYSYTKFSHETINGRRLMVATTIYDSDVVVRGTLYPALLKNDRDITALHELHGRRCLSLYTAGPFIGSSHDLIEYAKSAGPGHYELKF